MSFDFGVKSPTHLSTYLGVPMCAKGRFDAYWMFAQWYPSYLVLRLHTLSPPEYLLYLEGNKRSPPAPANSSALHTLGSSCGESLTRTSVVSHIYRLIPNELGYPSSWSAARKPTLQVQRVSTMIKCEM